MIERTLTTRAELSEEKKRETLHRFTELDESRGWIEEGLSSSAVL